MSTPPDPRGDPRRRRRRALLARSRGASIPKPLLSRSSAGADAARRTLARPRASQGRIALDGVRRGARAGRAPGESGLPASPRAGGARARNTAMAVGLAAQRDRRGGPGRPCWRAAGRPPHSRRARPSRSDHALARRAPRPGAGARHDGRRAHAARDRLRLHPGGRTRGKGAYPGSAPRCAASSRSPTWRDARRYLRTGRLSLERGHLRLALGDLLEEIERCAPELHRALAPLRRTGRRPRRREDALARPTGGRPRFPSTWP